VGGATINTGLVRVLIDIEFIAGYWFMQLQRMESQKFVGRAGNSGKRRSCSLKSEIQNPN
jgi:hypothetical protein